MLVFLIHSDQQCLFTRLSTGLFFLLSLHLVSCAGNGSHHISQDVLLNSIEKEIAPTIIDVRSQSEYESGHVPGAIHLPFYSLWTRQSEIGSLKKEQVVLYCEHGPRAGIAKFELWTAGFEKILYLEGHMSGWKERKLPMEK